jgi:nicotinate-nucleotide adenylyltransferase
MKIGLYFGSFNPVHNGHLIIAKHVINNTDLKQVWMVISPQNPLKNSNSLLNKYDRLSMVQSALEGEPKIKASTIEFNLPSPSFTVDTLAYLKEKYTQHQFSIIMGSDSFTNIKKWKNYETIIKNYEIYVYQRTGYPIQNIEETIVNKLDAPLIEISSSAIRKIIKDGKSIRYLVPDVVDQQIKENKYYKKKLY